MKVFYDKSPLENQLSLLRHGLDRSQKVIEAQKRQKQRYMGEILFVRRKILQAERDAQ